MDASWQSFFMAEAGAAAALAGLLFVGISINLSRIISISRLPSRAFAALLLLVTVLLIASLALVPQSQLFLGAEILLIGLFVWITILTLDIRVWRQTDAQFRRSFAMLITVNELATLSYVVAGGALALGYERGIYFLVPAMLISLVKAMGDAWVLLVEINR
jgi:modulator of FtsH protease